MFPFPSVCLFSWVSTLYLNALCSAPAASPASLPFALRWAAFIPYRPLAYHPTLLPSSLIVPVAAATVSSGVCGPWSLPYNARTPPDDPSLRPTRALA